MNQGLNCRSHKRAFTLIELLVVIAIIAILAAILFPVFARARENARRASCQSNMKQLGLGLIQYAQDYDEKLPHGVYNVSAGPPNDHTFEIGQGWGGSIYPYVKSSQIFACPSDSSTSSQTGTRISYAYNASIPVEIKGNLSQFTATAKTVLLCEVAGFRATVDQGSEYQGSDTFSTSPSTNGLSLPLTNTSGSIFVGAGNAAFSREYGAYATGYMGGRGGQIGTDNGKFLAEQGRHLEGSNFLMTDGHVKWLKGDKVSSGSNAAGADDNQTTNGASSLSAGTNNSGFAVTFSTK